MNLKSFLAAAASTVGILSLSSPASAVIYDWQFTNEDGNFGEPTDVVAGFVEFNDADVASGSGSAIDLQITSVTNLPSKSDPFFGDGGIELNQNLVLEEFGNNFFVFDGDGSIVTVIFQKGVFDGNDFEVLRLRNDGNETYLLNDFSEELSSDLEYEDLNSSTLIFTQQGASASVPFEFSPTLGLVLAGSVFAGRGYIKRRQARSIMENK